jgi:hypothetical protein
LKEISLEEGAMPGTNPAIKAYKIKDPWAPGTVGWVSPSKISAEYGVKSA